MNGSQGRHEIKSVFGVLRRSVDALDTECSKLKRSVDGTAGKRSTDTFSSAHPPLLFGLGFQRRTPLRVCVCVMSNDVSSLFFYRLRLVSIGGKGEKKEKEGGKKNKQ